VLTPRVADRLAPIGVMPDPAPGLRAGSAQLVTEFRILHNEGVALTAQAPTGHQP
jgi:hypothetical protein